MTRWILGLAVLLAIDAGADDAVLSATALGPITFGSELREIETRIAESALPEEGEGNDACQYVSFSAYLETMFMVEHGIITRADVGPMVKNSLEVAVGALMEDVRKAHPAVQIQPHQYDPEGYYLIFPTADGRAAIVMEVGGGKVTDIRGGLEPSVEYVEGCL
jgi:hypothetical protein